MQSKQLTVGIAVVAALAVAGLFFVIQNPFTNSITPTLQVPIGQEQQKNTGLIVQDQELGTGPEAKAGDVVTVTYTGKLQKTGVVFDSTVGREPYSFVLGEGKVIAGWEQGLQGMKVGGKRLLIIPPELGYGQNGYGSIPGNATLVFEVQLLKVQPEQSVQTIQGTTPL